MNEQKGSKEHILACLSSSPSNAKIIKTAAQLASAFGGRFTALYVNTPADEKMGQENRQRLQSHIHLAESFGAEIATVYGEDIPQQIIEFARVSKVSKIVIGRSNATGHSLFGKQTLTDKLIRSAPGLDIHIIPDAQRSTKYRLASSFSAVEVPNAKKWGITLAVLALSTAFGFLFHSLRFTGANTITVYILGALLTALFTKNYICSGVFSVVSVLLFNFLFTEPRLSLVAYESGYPVTFIIMLVASLITGTLANKLASNARLSANAAYRTGIMLETNQLLQTADSEEKVCETLAGQLKKLLNRNIIIYPVEADHLGLAQVFPIDPNDECKLMRTPHELVAAKNFYMSCRKSGRPSDKWKDSLFLYFAVKSNDEIFCVVGVQVGSKSIEPFEQSMMVSILGECALAIENIRIAKEKEKISLLAKNEQLRANLLRTISHDLRTPLTSISGNTENLLMNYQQIDDETRRQLLTDVYDDSQWLISLVENLLSVSRISEGRMNMQMSVQLVSEVITEALRHVNRKGAKHNITTDFGDDLLLANMDARLISQVIINLVDNAIKYTPEGSNIKVSAHKDGENIKISVADNGDGIPDEKKTEVFKMFYTGENKVVDCRRSLGLGLSLCRSIVNAHGSEIYLTDNVPSGAVFTFTLKSSEVNLYE